MPPRTRKKKTKVTILDENGEEVEQEEEEYFGIGCERTEPSAPIEQLTNEGHTAFCPYIAHKRGHMHRKCVTGMKVPNYYYHWWQTENFVNYQNCKLRKDKVAGFGAEGFEMCEKRFTKCKFYLEAKGLVK
jgi:hypothetical protein